MAERLLKAEEAAPIFGVKPSTIYQWKRRKILVGYSTPHSRLIRFKESDIRKLFEAREVKKEKAVAS